MNTSHLLICRNAPLFLEWAPVDVYKNPKPSVAIGCNVFSSVGQNTNTDSQQQQQQHNYSYSGEEETEKLKRLLEVEDEGAVQHVSLFVKNLSFETSSEKLSEVFNSADGFLHVRSKTKNVVD